MPAENDPDFITTDERFRQLTTALRRLRLRSLLPAHPGEQPGPKNPSEFSPNGLELPRETVLNVHAG